MRKLLPVLLFYVALPALAAEQGAAQEALRAFGGPMHQIVQEAARGDQADLNTIASRYADAKAAWMQLTAKPLDLDEYDVPEESKDEVWRQVRTLGLVVGYMDEAVRRGDRATILTCASLLTPAYEKVSAALHVPRAGD